MANSQIYIDADACPVKDETFRVAGRYGLKTIVVSNGGLRPSRDPMIDNVVVAAGADIADDWIAERCGEGDVVITSDIPLAKRCIDAGAQVLGPTGKLFSKENIGMALAMRDLKQQLRESGEIKGYNASFTRRDRSEFLNSLDRIVTSILK
ncbi:MAG: YaiI/YqxD family protein [Rhizobiaceae bacterium]|nr:YaiI/YqxD family protein [Rhizobiaceae bacterium]MBL4731723.1 YaiI/YqxD family protein [Rhizobiaceae bacterium]